jgi:diguanylate cyclase (GGDEF)-like protein
MESHRNGRTAPEEDQWIKTWAPDSGRTGICLLSRYCAAPASAFGSQPEWIALARKAFADWIDQLGPVLPAAAESWFLADFSGQWLTLYRKEKQETPEEDSILQTALKEHLAGLNEEQGHHVQFEAGGKQASAAVLHDCGGNAALVLGAVLGPDDNAEVNKKNMTDWAASYPAFLYYRIEKAERQLLTEQQLLQEREARKKDILFQMAHDLYSKIDTDEILAEIIRRINEFYPDSQIDLLMTQDQPRSKLPVKPLRFVGMEEDSCTRAFMEGQIVIDEAGSPGEFEMAVPISGKQGIYGVMHLHSHKGNFEPSDVQIMKVLSGAAGSAFENAKLYEQSNILVNELRLINELTKQLNQSLKINEIFNFASAELLQIFRADYCCILQLNPATRQFVVQATNVPAMLHETFDEHAGYAGIVSESREPVIVSDYWTNPNVPSKLMQVTGARSLIAAPIIVHDEARGIILVAHRVPGFFTYDNYKLLQVLAGHVGLAVANASLHAEVRRMVITDNLTGLYARHYLDEQVGNHQKKDFCGSLIVVDIDHFKMVNDTYGHQVGDKILIQVSRIIKSSIRDTDIAARWGGEELAIYLPQVMTEQSAKIAERIRARVEKDTEPSVTVSCGVSEWNWQDEKISVESLFYRSDMALYKAKHEGRNSIKVG